MITSSLVPSVIRALGIASALVVSVSAFANQKSCDPTEVTDVIPLGALSDVEVTRQSGLFWVNVTPDESVVDENGEVLAAALHVRLDGGDCSAIAEAVRVKQGNSWKNLRLAGDSVFANGYFGSQMRFKEVQVGLNMFLLHRAYCAIAVDALIYAKNDPYLRRYPSPDPQC